MRLLALACAVVLVAFSFAVRPSDAHGPSLLPRVEALESAVAQLQARVTALEGPTPTPTPTPVPTPTPTPSGWTLAFEDQFTTWDPSRYFVYPGTWHDSSGHGTYTPSIISSDGQKLRINIKTVNGVHQVAAFSPLAAGTTGDLLGMRYEFRIRADTLPGYKGVPLLWPQSNAWPRDGEINWPEGSFNGSISAFMHRQGATSGSDQDWYPAPAGTTWQDWHTYVVEWIAGVSCEFFIDGVSIGKSTSRVPNTPMHLVMQFETNITPAAPDPSVSGFVEVEYLKVWSR